MLARLTDPDSGLPYEVRLSFDLKHPCSLPNRPVMVDDNGLVYGHRVWNLHQGVVIHFEPHERTRFPTWTGWAT
jgi:hypothetical protein